MVTVYCPDCKSKLAPLRNDSRKEDETTKHAAVENWAWCDQCKKPVQIIAKGVKQ